MRIKLCNLQNFILTSDRTIRVALREKLENTFKGKTQARIVEELGITDGAARIDIAVVNGSIHGYELKSDKDTLNRLPSQIKIYNSVFDFVTLVVGKNHLHEAIKIVPEWWGITVAKITNINTSMSFYNIREPEKNPSQDSLAIAALLWRDEALMILENIGEAKGVRSKNRKAIYQRLVEALDREQLSSVVRERLITRSNWRSGLQYTPGDG